MADFSPRKINLNEINGGKRYGYDGISPEAINRPIEASAYAQEIAENSVAKADYALSKVNDSEIGEITISAYPIGSIYMSVNNVSPAELFGGTWEKLEDRFLLGSGSKTVGAIGGSNSHNHSLSSNGYASIYIGRLDGVDTNTYGIAQDYVKATNAKSNRGAILETTSQANTVVRYDYQDYPVETATALGGYTDNANTEPPYLVVNMWKRIA